MSSTDVTKDLIKVSGGTTVSVEGNPDFGYLRCKLPPSAVLIVESGAMATMTSGLAVRSRLLGGFIRALIRKVFGGESLFVGEYSGPQGGELTISPAVPGMVIHRQLSGETILFQAGAYLASTPGVKIRTRFGGLRAIFGGEGLFFLEISGEGDVFINATGSIEERQVEGTFVVDTGHVVGWESSLDWSIGGMGGLKSTLLSGEGLVIKFSGRGKVWVQTRSEGGLVGWISGYCRG